MLKFAVNISMIGHPRPLEERLRSVAEAGFGAVEFWFPHQFDMTEMVRLTRDHGLAVALFDLEPSESHPYGHVADPDQGSEFFRRLDDAFATAHEFDCRVLNVLQGQRIESLPEDEQLTLVVDRLGEAADRASREGIVLCIEAINTFDRPGSFCRNTRIGAEIARRVASPWLRFQYDVYHMQLMEGDVLRTLRDNMDVIGHIQFADPPGRHEPGSGEIDFGNVMTVLEEVGYAGWVSLEYWPSSEKGDHFAWLPRHRRSVPRTG